MKFKILVAMVYLVPFFLLAKQQTVIGCFSSGRINLKYTEVLSDDVSLGYVVYEKSSRFIPLAFIKKTEMVFDDRPSEFTYSWSEVIDGKVNGLYVVSSQGARFNSFYYKSKKGNIFNFQENIDAYNKNGTDCIW
ncbi:TPA: hypothetical protein JEL63_004546 [Salmonella enterica subsp. enterica serovar Enteritidis]|uniref:hypothetical protein n=1 Tax=Salmonella enterica TaxID=28901 RepID=UPI0002A6C2F1|nr:hypothetical protein [Salmonella enterica]ELO80724.1 hypothetical protein SEEERB17_003972 [Salmonella enterica subsp. enterica serovar Enteritidis str. SARB17]EIX6435576.1 hypothetical protein [Salmonella enterica]EJX0634529.1 hypothetical protein [Salmonella enterica]HAE4698314.1 hypothetical protein [Salmonella enterica subsp. enterica serovar Enteritidis]HAU6875052.1 hypothetical protein [Salmonella enterica subsp. enterica serovar Enteritidis]